MTAPTSDAAALMAAILESPADDAPRLILADWLDEHGRAKCDQCAGSGFRPITRADMPPIRERVMPDGRIERYAEVGPALATCRDQNCSGCDGLGWHRRGFAERAAFIRCQVELARLESVLCHQPGAKLGDGCNDSLCPRCGPEHTLHSRERELWEAGGVGGMLAAEFGSKVIYPQTARPERCCRLRAGGVDYVVRRGFVDEARLMTETFVGGPCRTCGESGFVPHHAGSGLLVNCPACGGTGATAGLAAALGGMPLGTITLTDREPAKNAVGYFWWYCTGPAGLVVPEQIPVELWRLVYGFDPPGRGRDIEFPTAAAAVAALSTALIAHAHARG